MPVLIDGTNGLSFNDGSTQATAASGFGFKNRIINGAMVIDQRNAGASVTPGSGNTYTLDRWQLSVSLASKLSVQQNAGSVTPPTGFRNYLGLTSLSAYAIGGNDYFSLCHATEGHNTSDLMWGTSSASSITVSFWVRASIAGNYSFAIRNYGTYNRSYVTSYNVATANTWQYITLVIPGDTTGTWTGASNSGSFLIDWAVGAVGLYSTATSGWQSGNVLGLSSATSVVGTNGATFYITGVQLEKGSTATSFDFRPFGTELALCQRYYETVSVYVSTSAWPTIANGAGPKVTKRASPTLILTNFGSGSGAAFTWVVPAVGDPGAGWAYQTTGNSAFAAATLQMSIEL